jgi:hypothetical protein
MNRQSNEVGFLVARLLERPERLIPIVNGAVESAADRLGLFEDRRRRRRSVHPALIFTAGVAAGVGVAVAVTLRSRRWRRVKQHLREDAALHAERVAGYDDAELVHHVESVIFRDESLPKGEVSINAEQGKIFLRGQVDSPESIVRIERAVREVEGVDGVENLLHVPGTPAPHAHGGALLDN